MGCFRVSPSDCIRKEVDSMKWLTSIIKILHILAVIGTYAAVFEIILKALHALLSLLGF